MINKDVHSRDLFSEKATSTIIIGRSFYCSHERDYEKDVKATYDAYVDALEQARKWVENFKGDLKQSAKVYGMQYIKPATATHVPLKAGVNEYIFRQKLRVFVKEVEKIDNLSPEDIAVWKVRDKKSRVADPETSSVSLNNVGEMPLTVYKIVEADGANWKDTFENLTAKLRAIKNINTFIDPAAEDGQIKSLADSCDHFDLLRGNENHIEAGVIITVPYVYEFEKPHLVDVHEVPAFSLTE